MFSVQIGIGESIWKLSASGHPGRLAQIQHAETYWLTMVAKYYLAGAIRRKASPSVCDSLRLVVHY